MDTCIKIDEYSKSCELDLSPVERNLVKSKYKNKLELTRPEEGDKYLISTNSHIGIFKLGRYKIYVEPKAPLACVFKMLCYAYELDMFYDDLAKYENSDELFEYLIDIFLHKVARLIKEGLFSNYKNQDDDLKYIRGRINIPKLINNPCNKLIVSCNYDEYNTDVIENQIIKYTLSKLNNREFKDSNIKKYLKNIEKHFGNITLKAFALRDIVSIQYTRLNSHYLPLHRFCRMILEFIGVSEIKGQEMFNSYSLNMNTLFELYVARLLKEKLKEFDVITKPNQYLDEEREHSRHPDIVIRKNAIPLLVLDTKYKIDSKPKDGDIDKMANYLQINNASGVLIYPKYQIKEKAYTINNRKIYIKTIDLNPLNPSGFVTEIAVLIDAVKK